MSRPVPGVAGLLGWSVHKPPRVTILQAKSPCLREDVWTGLDNSRVSTFDLRQQLTRIARHPDPSQELAPTRSVHILERGFDDEAFHVANMGS